MAQLTELTPFSTDPGDELPVGVQLTWRLRSLIRSGRLAPGERMPSVRELAGWAAVNVNTVRSIYAGLEREGMIVTRQGAGSFVAATVTGSAEIERIAGEAILAARAAGVDPREVAVAAHVGATVRGTRGAPWIDEAGARAALRDQIGRVEAELAAYSRDLPAADPAERPITAPDPHIASVGELEATRDTLVDRLAAARRAAAKRTRAELDARALRDAMLADPGAHRRKAVSASEAGEPGCTTWESAPRFGPLGVLMSWWRVRVSGGCPLCPSDP